MAFHRSSNMFDVQPEPQMTVEVTEGLFRQRSESQ